DSNDGAQRQGRNAEARLAVEDSVEPRVTDRMLRHVLPKRIDEDVDVRENHLKCFMRSTYSRSSISWMAAESLMSIPGQVPPVALLTGIGARRRFCGFR